jgi:hypothetical protein
VSKSEWKRLRPGYQNWDSMKQRCLNPNNQNYRYYGGRGIKVCEEWLSYSNFFRDMGAPPPGFSLERIDVNGNYEPKNCKWIPRGEQAKNTRRTNRFSLNGETIITKLNFAKTTGHTVKTLERRLSSSWSESEIAALPKGWKRENVLYFDGKIFKNFKEAAKAYGVNFNTAACRYYNRKWTLEQTFKTDNSKNIIGMGAKKHEHTRNNTEHTSVDKRTSTTDRGIRVRSDHGNITLHDCISIMGNKNGA